MDRNGRPGESRTHDLRIMRATLLPTELQVLVEGLLPTNMVPMGIEPMAVCLIIARI